MKHARLVYHGPWTKRKSTLPYYVSSAHSFRGEPISTNLRTNNTHYRLANTQAELSHVTRCSEMYECAMSAESLNKNLLITSPKYFCKYGSRTLIKNHELTVKAKTTGSIGNQRIKIVIMFSLLIHILQRGWNISQS